MSARSILTSALALSLALSPVTGPSFAASQYRSDLVDPSWKLSNDESPTYRPAGIDKIQTVVVIYAENRSFDNLYGLFPGADGLTNAQQKNRYLQVDRNGAVLANLPATWGGLPGWTQAQTANLPNLPFAIDNPRGFREPETVTTRDLVHRFYQNQMQIDNGTNDKFAAWTDAGGLTMGFYANSALLTPMWKVAQRNVLADNFFYAAFGGSFLNHQFLICACAPVQQNPADTSVSVVNADGISLTTTPASPASAIQGPPAFVLDGRQTPDHHAVNTSQPPYQPSGNPPAQGGNPLYADPNAPSTVWALDSTKPENKTIGDLLSAAKVNWAWYAGAWQDALDHPANIYNNTVPNFQPHHQPFNYYTNYAPGTAARAAHLKDGGLAGVNFIKDIDAGVLPAVTFYKPQGNLNEHPGYANVSDGDAHIANVIAHLQAGPQWKNMLVIVTYDENGGFWDHATPPKGDRWGPGSRIPTIIVSPYAKAGTVDHSPYDTTSVLRFIMKRFLGTAASPIYPGNLLPGIKTRDDALRANGFRRPADLSGALNLN